MTLAKRVAVLLLGLILVCGMAPVPASAGHVLQRIKANGYVTCGINYLPGFSGVKGQSNPAGMDVDYCRALAMVVLGNPDAIRLSRVNSRHKFQAVRDGEVDVNFGITAWTLERETVEKVAFTAPSYYDAQGFLVWSDSGVTDLADVTRSSICVQSTTSTASNLLSWLGEGHKAKIILTATSEEKVNAFAERECLVMTGAVVELTGYKYQHAFDPGMWKILPASISRTSFTPMVSPQDRQWESIVRWVVWVPILAELHGLTRDSVSSAPDRVPPQGDREIRRLLGLDPAFGKGLELEPDWARQVIATIGNYAEMFDRHMSPMGIERGPNRLWRDGGIFLPPSLN